MSKPRKSRRRELTADELRLWQHAMRDTKALHRRQTHPAAREEEPSEARAPSSQPPQPTANPPRNRPSHTANLSTASGSAASSAANAPALTPLGRRQARRIVRGQETIDARLDLHGMRQREAHQALRAFLLRCQAQGHRMVLIITGKGSRREEQAEHFFYTEPHGVLRRVVPEWLREPEFREIVTSVSQAHIRHGGEGALYVRLRKVQPAGKQR